MQSLQLRHLSERQQSLICCIERQGELAIVQHAVGTINHSLISAKFRPSSSPPLFGARSRRAAIARLGEFVGLDTMCVIPLAMCELQHVPVHEVDEDQIDDHVLESLCTGLDMDTTQFALGTLGLGGSSSGSVMGIAATKDDIRVALRPMIEAGFNPSHLDIEELACIRGLHKTMMHHDQPCDFVLCRYTSDHMVLALADTHGSVHLLRMIAVDDPHSALSPASIASSIAHQIDMLMISIGQQSRLPASGPRVYIAIDPTLGVNAMMAIRRNKMMAAISIDEIDDVHPWVEQMMSEHGLDAYEAITMLGMLCEADSPIQKPADNPVEKSEESPEDSAELAV